MKRILLGALGVLALSASLAVAQAPPPPQVQQINPGDLFQDVVNGQPQAGNVYANAQMLTSYYGANPGANPENAIIGGDFGRNLYQDGTTVSTITTTATYVADQWAAFSGTSTTIGGTQQTGSTDIPVGFSGSERITRSGAGILQSCIAQEISTPESIRFQGTTAELDFHAKAGSGFSSATSALSVYLVQGTGTDEGMTNLAHTINSALGGSYWTGYTTAAVSNASVTISQAWNRYTVAVPVASTTTELGVVICYTPVGASPSNDWFEFTGALLTPNNSLTPYAGTTGAALNINDVRARSYPRLPLALEYIRQYQYYDRISEGALGPSRSQCHFTTANSVMQCPIIFPVVMYKAPTMAYTTGFAGFTTTAETTANACTGLATDATVALASSTSQVMVQCTIASGTTAAVGLGMTLIDNGGSGVIKANARF